MLDLIRLPFSKEVAKLFGSKTPFVVILRPDNYIGLISYKITIDEVKSYLALKK